MMKKKTYYFKRLVPVVTLLLTFSVAYPLSSIRDKQRQQAFKLYTAREYDSALPLLRDFVFHDTTVFHIMDYFMLADIYIRNADKDSARLVISRGRSLSENKQDDRLLKRNLEFFDSLEVQLKYRTASLKTPKIKSLESYVEIVIDTTALDSLAGVDSLALKDSLAVEDSLSLEDSLSIADPVLAGDSLLSADTLAAAKTLPPDILEIAPPDLLDTLIQNTIAPQTIEPDSAAIQKDSLDTEEQSGEEK